MLCPRLRPSVSGVTSQHSTLAVSDVAENTSMHASGPRMRAIGEARIDPTRANDEHMPNAVLRDAVSKSSPVCT